MLASVGVDSDNDEQSVVQVPRHSGRFHPTGGLTRGATTPADVVRVEFEGDRGGLTVPLTWGQRAIWEVVRWLESRAGDLNLVEVCPLASGTDRATVVAALAGLLERHESLRTRITDIGDGPQQHVERSGALALAVHETSDGDHAETVSLVEELAAPAFAEDELPVRAAVLCDGGPRTLVLVVSHLAVDGWSMEIVREDLLSLLTGGELPPLAEQPVDRVHYESSDPARTKEKAAFDHWAAAMRDLPRVWLEELPRTGQDDLVCSEIISPALGDAVSALASRHKLTPSMVLQAGTALALCLHRQETDIGIRLIVATRYTADTTRFVGPFNQNALLRIALREESLGDFFARVRAASFRALGASEYDPVVLEDVVAAATAGRGFRAGGYCFINDLSGFLPPGYAEEPDPRAEDDLPDDTVVTDLPPTANPKDANLFLYVHEIGRRVRLSVIAHRRFLAPGTTAGFLRDVEWLLMEAARTGAGPAELARAQALRRGVAAGG
jgi:hypothetical protein